MGFEWGGSDIPSPGTRGWWDSPQWDYDTRSGRPSPPWPQSGKSVLAYGCCLGCPRASRCAECPVDDWEGRYHDGTPARPENPSPSRTQRLLSRLRRRR